MDYDVNNTVDFFFEIESIAVNNDFILHMTRRSIAGGFTFWFTNQKQECSKRVVFLSNHMTIPELVEELKSEAKRFKYQ